MLGGCRYPAASVAPGDVLPKPRVANRTAARAASRITAPVPARTRGAASRAALRPISCTTWSVIQPASATAATAPTNTPSKTGAPRCSIKSHLTWRRLQPVARKMPSVRACRIRSARVVPTMKKRHATSPKSPKSTRNPSSARTRGCSPSTTSAPSLIAIGTPAGARSRIARAVALSCERSRIRAPKRAVVAAASPPNACHTDRVT